MTYFNKEKFKLGTAFSFFALFILVGKMEYKNSNSQSNFNLLYTSNEEKQPYVKPCNSIETCFTFAKGKKQHEYV